MINTFEFFNQHFGRHLLKIEGEPHVVAGQVLSTNHKLVKGTDSRLSSGWAIIRPGRSSLQLKLAATGLHYDERTRIEAFMEEFDKWDGIEPRMFLMFDKAPVPIANLFMSLDRRVVRICSPAGVESFNLDEAPTDESDGIQKAIWKRKKG